jgi:immunity protein 5 of polymorphic toxin system
MADEIILDMEDLRAVAAYAAENAADVLEIFERSYPSDSRPRDAVDTAWTFARGGRRVKALRDAAWAAMRAAHESEDAAASQAARAAMGACSAAYLHPLARAAQVKHILGAAAHAARATELVAGNAPSVGVDYLECASRRATPRVVEVLGRYPLAPSGGGRVGELLRSLDRTLRGAIS